MKLFITTVLVIQFLTVVLVVNAVERKHRHCGRHEKYNECGIPLDCVRNCQNKDILVDCLDVCTAACYCKKGYIREYDNGPCICKRDCPVYISY